MQMVIAYQSAIDLRHVVVRLALMCSKHTPYRVRPSCHQAPHRFSALSDPAG